MKRSLPGRFASGLAVAPVRRARRRRVPVVQDQCGPFTDVTPGFCPYILEIYYLGITAGTSPTTFSPDDPLTRGQGAVFIAKGLNQALARSSRRAALGQWWTTKSQNWRSASRRSAGTRPATVSDGADVWVTFSDHVLRIRAWTSESSKRGRGRIRSTGSSPQWARSS